MKGLPLKQKRFLWSIYGLALILWGCIFIQSNFMIRIKDFRTLVFFIVITALTESVTLYFNKLILNILQLKRVPYQDVLKI